ncbi:hypothetical protein, partial [Saccharothrix longispora]|uniref:hypothetical protein n=1 Tax=Saccharothrix longispora TaxID=33920 RepID=UPI0028FD44CC
FLNRANNDNGDLPNLTLQIHVSADEDLGNSVLRTIGIWLFRGTPFDIITDAAARSSLAPGSTPPGGALTPPEVLRIFHPPYGKIEGRGLSGRSVRAVPLPAITIPADGVSLGSARSSQGR